MLANNHVMDWDYAGLTETLTSLAGANIKVDGVGRNLRDAEGYFYDSSKRFSIRSIRSFSRS
jgi:poly-gamma-glutamate capsule biosynthesis protein CapA/YwtB (metallophosphatase superfamily)